MNLDNLLKELQSKFPNITGIVDKGGIIVIYLKGFLPGGLPIEIKGKDVEYIIEN